MPHTRIEVVHGWAQELKPFLIEAVHAAQVATLKIPSGDRVIRITQ